ncbi:beta and beta-prime subunits of DNA dependent RNA-polymerase [Neolentinus lepideus HHB14362 ss-1]|uniref:DNA-directed RNA polymerase subunit n=1 Tax=Neolentinus lepideus HHB14362 ss-1 TaxID=1314782 RepID=A0A165V7M6_9AGAM|nr:beta and beta-prime subunits of DNA dependent RNA-polymerase [Neolentinus lepideus HHB14362 ss-1]
MNISNSIPSTVTSISFSFLTTEEIRRISVKQIVNPVLLDDLNRPNIGGLYDPALGPSDKQDICATCRLTYFTCPGHFGHIELPSPVFHPLFMMNMYNLLRGTCLFCHKFKMERASLCKYIAKFRLLERGLLEEAMMVDEIRRATRKKGDADDDDDNEVAEESIEIFEWRVSAYVQTILLTRQSRTRDDYKDPAVYQARKDLMLEFLKATISKKCHNCKAFGYTFRKEGHTKIIEYDLARKHKEIHAALNIKRPNVLSAPVTTHSTANGRRIADFDSSDSESEPEPAGENTFSDQESENDVQPVQPSEETLPKSASGKVKTSRGRNERVMASEECRAHLRRLFANEAQICSLLFGRHGPFASITPQGIVVTSPDMFFMEVLPVTPTRFRPPAKMGEMLFEHPQNELLARVLTTCYRLRDRNVELRAAGEKGSGVGADAQKRLLGQLLDALIQLQVDVNSFIDSSKNPQPMRQGKLPPPGVKQLLEKKEGLFRKHMMGKRVNYAARSVISPDVNIEPSEIGIPPVFAQKLTFPEPVIPANFHQLRQYVINGPKQYPGATMVEFEDGHLQFLDKLSVEQRTAIANQLLTPQEGSASLNRHGLPSRTPSVNKKVYRHLRDGDILILNRQPTLHKPSMMAHKAKVLQGEKTIRMHYANCNSYNADFDGDEMNIHFPQNQIARAEAYNIANTDNQYLVPTSGKPLRGLIQDHVVAGVWMTNKDTFFTREEYFQLLYGAIRPEDESHTSGRLMTLPPTVWKPRPLWTGKQIISTVLLNITPDNAEGLNVDSKAKVPGSLWGKDSEEDIVIFRDGELLCGVLDKSSFGATDYGLVHSVYELYGADVAEKLLGILSRLFTKFLQHRAFTCRMDDLALTPDGDTSRRMLLEKGENLGTEGAIENFPSLENLPAAQKPSQLTVLLEDVLRDDNKMAGLDVTVKTKLAKLTKSIADACMPHGLLRKFPHNHMQAMTQSGAKGSAVNAQQISCALGQQELEGRRVPVMVSGKTLPSFKAFETRAIAGGYVASRFLTGIKPQEFFFHCMAGREGLIDTAVKTSRSGYLQRCLIKHLEGMRVHYDHTVRGSDSSVYQFHYGGDALDVTKQKHIMQFGFIALNANTLINRYRPREIVGAVNDEDALSYMKKVLKARKKGKKNADNYEPALSRFSPSRCLGSTSEKFAEKVAEYVKANPQNLLRSKDGNDKVEVKRRHPLLHTKTFQLLMNVKYMRSLIEPGEAVGLLASQGVGEPSTQMTLNTFHFAGHGAANVTLGIPRLREIVMTASTKPKTPSMTMTTRADAPIEEVEAFCKNASRLALSQVVDHVTVQESLTVNGAARNKQYTIDIGFFPEDEYRSEYDVEPREILAAFGSRFPQLLKKEIMREMKKLDTDLKGQISVLGKGTAVKERVPAPTDDDEDGGAAGGGKDDDQRSELDEVEDEKNAKKKQQHATYESDDDGDVDMDELDDAAIEAAYADNDEPMEDEGPQLQVSKSESLLAQISAVEKNFMDNFSRLTSFKFTESHCVIELMVSGLLKWSFEADFPKLLLVGIVERVCQKTVIREIPSISDCFRVREESKDGKTKLTTNGSNFQGLWEVLSYQEESIIEENNIYSNDINAILVTYGVEAARSAIISEVSNVFDAYKIDVDIRHLELIADYMTFDGGYKPFNRRGISTHSSPLLKASYETTAAFISDATLYGDFDTLTSPSGSIVLGRPNGTGTGAFDVVMPVQDKLTAAQV